MGRGLVNQRQSTADLGVSKRPEPARALDRLLLDPAPHHEDEERVDESGDDEVGSHSVAQGLARDETGDAVAPDSKRATGPVTFSELGSSKAR